MKNQKEWFFSSSSKSVWFTLSERGRVFQEEGCVVVPLGWEGIVRRLSQIHRSERVAPVVHYIRTALVRRLCLFLLFLEYKGWNVLPGEILWDIITPQMQWTEMRLKFSEYSFKRERICFFFVFFFLKVGGVLNSHRSVSGFTYLWAEWGDVWKTWENRFFFPFLSWVDKCTLWQSTM